MSSRWLLLAIALVVFITAGCGDSTETVQEDRLVKTQKVSMESQLREIRSYPGVVKGRYETNMAFQVGGRIISRNVQLGDTVRSGDVLMSIDARDVVQQANQSEAQVAAAKAQLDLAQSNLSRYRELYAQQAVSASVLDQHQTNYDSALASYNNAVAQSIQGRNAMEYTDLVSNADGVISAINAEMGQVVGAGQTVLTMTRVGEIEVEANIPENSLSDMPMGQEVSVRLWANKDDAIYGYVREISPMADSVSRTFKVRISIPNPPEGIKLGMTATVLSRKSPLGNKANSVLLPFSAVYQDGDAPLVWVVDEATMTIHTKEISVEPSEGNMASVTGLSEGDIVVIAGVHKLRNGERVRLMGGESG